MLMQLTRHCGALLMITALGACASDAEGGEGGSSGTSEGDAGTNPSGNPTNPSDPTSDPTDDPTDDPTGSDAPGTDDTSPSDETGDDTGPMGLEPLMPIVTGTCPEFVPGDITFNPKGIEPRQAHIWMTDAAYDGGGRLQFYFHGTGGNPMEAEWGFNAYDTNNIDMVTAAGGIVVAPYNDPATGTYPWWLTNGDRDDDLLLMDEIVACAVQEVGIDLHRIHSAGFSAGGLHTSKASYLRSVYLASVVIYSGGFVAPDYAPWDSEPDNKFAAMVMHGGDTDVYGGSVDFQELSAYYVEQLLLTERLPIQCNHGTGHLIGPDQNFVHRFFDDHPWGSQAYAAGLPADFPAYCDLP